MSLFGRDRRNRVQPGQAVGADFQLPPAEAAQGPPVNANRRAGASAQALWIAVVGLLVLGLGYTIYALLAPATGLRNPPPQTYAPTAAAATPALAVNAADDQVAQINAQTAEIGRLRKQNEDTLRALQARDAAPAPAPIAADAGPAPGADQDPANARGRALAVRAVRQARQSMSADGSRAEDREASQTSDKPPQRAAWTVVANSPGHGAEGLPPPATPPGNGSGRSSGAGVTSRSVSSTLEVYDSARYVPPNAYVEARVIVGVDAAAGTSFSADPKPVLFRLQGPAIHVGPDSHRQTTDLDGCEVNGAAYAELSSEKVYIKLQKITCPVAPGRFSVATVEGYVSSRGKAGVRGRVISREGQLTTKALVAGTLQGLGQAMSLNVQRSQAGSVTTGGANGLLGAKELSPEQIASGAVGTGISSASAILANYYIQRAEQYQPVIEMPTGIRVTLVFLNGFQVR